MTSTAVPGTPAAPTSITLAGGATSSLLRSHIGAGETKAYAVRGTQGQPMLVSLESTDGDASLIVLSQGGTYFLRPGIRSDWRGTLPEAGTYYLGVYGGANPTEYSLFVQFVDRIRFKEGANAATVSGRAPGGSSVAYSVLGEKGDRLSVTLSGTGRAAFLAVSGFVDGNTYLRALEGKISFALELPTTQDYVLMIVSSSGESVGYILDVKID
jgi:hypothetical protein